MVLNHTERRAFEVIDERASACVTPTSTAQLAELLGINRQYAYRLLVQLMAKAWIRPDPRRINVLPTLKACIAEHFGDVEDLILAHWEAIATGRPEMDGLAREIAAGICAKLPERHMKEARQAWPNQCIHLWAKNPHPVYASIRSEILAYPYLP